MTLIRKSGPGYRIFMDIKSEDEVARLVWHSSGGKADLRNRAIKVAALAKQIAPKGKTGNLKNSIRAVQAREDNGRFASGWDVEASAPYALFVHYNTKPHTIVPRNKSVLRFEVGGQIVFARKVRHPGTKGQPFLSDAIKAAL